MTQLHSINLNSVGDTELFAAIQDFIGSSLPAADRQSEGYTVDFKQEWGDKSLRVVAGFANTFGGIIVIGVSEAAGRADEIIGASSAARELKTQVAASIASNITPTPDYDIAECALPRDASKRLVVVRVRPDPRIHYYLKGEHPVYIRNGDQAIPARAAELRSLIDRERSLDHKIAIHQDPFSPFPQDFRITNPRQTALGKIDRVDAQSFMRMAIQPYSASHMSLDYQYEERFKNLIAARFGSSQQAVENGLATESDARSRTFYLYRNNRAQPDFESVWAVVDSGTVGFASTFGVYIQGLVWSLPDLAANIASTISLANDVLEENGYYGEVNLTVEVNPGGGALLREGTWFPSQMRKDRYSCPWPIVIPSYERRSMHGTGKATRVLNFDSRFGDLSEVVSDVLNQLLRDIGFSPDLAAIRTAVNLS
jgi:hypothetical protein